MVTLRAHELDRAVAQLIFAVEFFFTLQARDPKNIFANRHA